MAGKEPWIRSPRSTLPGASCYARGIMEYFFHFLKFLGVFFIIIALSLFGMQLVGA